jgi:hypothetical protein
MTKRSLADLAAAFNKKASSGGGNQEWKLFFPFWKADVDTTTTIRFLPDRDEDNELSFLVENLTHELMVNGKKETVACLEMHGERCPICELSRKYYDKSGPDHNEQLGKKYYRKKSYVGQVLVVDSPIEYDSQRLVHLIEFGPAIYKAIQAGFTSGDMEEVPYAFNGGYNFRIRKTQNGEYAGYTTSSFAAKQTDLEPAVVEAVMAELYDLKQYRAKKVDLATVELMLEADRTGRSVQRGDDAPAPTPATPRPAAEPTKTTAEPAAAAPAAGTKPMSVLEQLRARQAAASQQSE